MFILKGTKNLRIYGIPPLNLAVIHGGPGAPGEMAPIARELFSLGGVLEPFQTALTIEVQIKEKWLMFWKNMDQFQ